MRPEQNSFANVEGNGTLKDISGDDSHLQRPEEAVVFVEVEGVWKMCIWLFNHWIGTFINSFLTLAFKKI